MSSLQIASIIFAFVFGGALLGVGLRTIIPEPHLSADTRDAIKLAVGIVATMSALILGLLVSSAKTSFDTSATEISQLSGDLILLDRQLVHYGPDAKDIRDVLRRYIEYKINATWRGEASSPPDPGGWKLLEDVQDGLRGLRPADDAQRWLQSRALQISGEIAHVRWLQRAQQAGSSIPTPFIVILVIWLTIVFMSLRSVCASEHDCRRGLESPFDGMIQVSSAPMRAVLSVNSPVLPRRSCRLAKDEVPFSNDPGLLVSLYPTAHAGDDHAGMGRRAGGRSGRTDRRHRSGAPICHEGW